MRKHKKLIIVLSSVITAIVILFFVLQLVIGSILQSKLENSMSGRDNTNYSISVEKVKINLFTMTLIFNNISITPDSILVTELKNKKSDADIALQFNIPNIRIRNIGLITLLKNRQVNISNFVINKANIVVLTSKKIKTPKADSKDNSPHIFNLDSIALPGVNGIDIGKFTFADFSILVMDVVKADTVFEAKSLNIAIDKVSLVKNESDSISFRLIVDDANLHMQDEEFRLPGGKYILSFGDLIFEMNKAHLVFKKLKIKPLYGLNHMARLSKFQYEILNVEIEKAETYSFNLREILRDSKIYLSDIQISDMNLKIYKDQTRPFDEQKRPKLPQQLLKSLTPQIYIDSILIKNSELTFSARRKENKAPMVVTLGKLNVKVSNITSVMDSIIEGRVLTVNLKANLQKKIPMGVNMYLPLNSIADTFSFDGWLNGGSMKLFDPIVLPVLGIKFYNGQLDGITFSARANPVYSIGEMTMLYHDLEAEVVKNDTEETNKFLSWAAKQVIKSNNPAKDKEKRIVPMYFDRVVYKGQVNFLWRTLQSGIVATLIPTMDTKVQNDIYTILGIDKNQVKKEIREEKREEKKKKRRVK